MSLDHEYCNAVIEEYIKELNSPSILNKKTPQPGNIYHTPVLLRGLGNTFVEIDTYTNLKDATFNTYIGSVKDAQTRGQRRVSRQLLGYIMMMRSSRDKTLKENLKFIIDNAVLDMKEKFPKVYNDVPYVGEFFITFVKDSNGNYFRDVEDSAAYELQMYSCCGLNPPSTIDVNTFDKKEAKDIWGIDL